MHAPVHADIHVPPPGHPLAPYVLAVFRVRWDGRTHRETILPKGNVDLMFNLGCDVRGTLEGGEAYLAREGSAWVSGVKTRPFRVEPHASVDLLGVSLRAEWAAAVLPFAPGEIANREAHEAPRAFGLAELGDRLRELPSFDAQCALLLRWLGGRLRPPRGAPLARQACALLRASREAHPVHATAGALAVSARHLRRLVTEHVGVAPAEYVRLARFVDAMHRISRPGPTLGQVAHAAGYFDQAHLCRDFRDFAGLSPQAYRLCAAPHTPGHLFTS
jgi:AraC-like DNA-binding protein